MNKTYQDSAARVKLISELLIAFKRLLPKYDGIERKRLERRIAEMEKFLLDIFEV